MIPIITHDGDTRKLKRYYLILLLGLVVGVGHIKPIFAEGLTGKPINYMVGSKIGGGYDRIARLISPYLELYLDNNNEVVVLNRPKSSGIGTINKLARTRFADARTIMLFNTGLLLFQMGDNPGLKADLSTLRYIGKATSEARYLIVAAQSGINSFEDLLAYKGTLKFVASTTGTASYIQTALLKNVFDMPLRILTGFGSSESRAAMIKGEIDGLLTSESNVAKLVTTGVAVPILRFGSTQTPNYLKVQDASTVARTEEQNLVVDKIVSMTELGRVTATSPGISDETLDALRTAYRKALNDKQMIAAAQQQGIEIDMLPGEEVEERVKGFLNTNNKFKQLVQSVRPYQ